MDERQKARAREELQRWQAEHCLSKSELRLRKDASTDERRKPLTKAERKRRDERRQAVLDRRQLRVPLLNGVQ
jgi:hypothetical protein